MGKFALSINPTIYIMNIFLRFVLITMLFFNLAHASAENLYPFTSSSQTEQFNSLTKQVRCVVCQNQTVADSNALLATDLRNKIYHMILENKSDAEIKDYLINRYGEFILLQPPFHQSTFILWLFPWLAMVLTFSWLVIRFYVNRSTKNNK